MINTGHIRKRNPDLKTILKLKTFIQRFVSFVRWLILRVAKWCYIKLKSLGGLERQFHSKELESIE